jgi:hypothetical protein
VRLCQLLQLALDYLMLDFALEGELARLGISGLLELAVEDLLFRLRVRKELAHHLAEQLAAFMIVGRIENL